MDKREESNKGDPSDKESITGTLKPPIYDHYSSDTLTEEKAQQITTSNNIDNSQQQIQQQSENKPQQNITPTSNSASSNSVTGRPPLTFEASARNDSTNNDYKEACNDDDKSSASHYKNGPFDEDLALEREASRGSISGGGVASASQGNFTNAAKKSRYSSQRLGSVSYDHAGIIS